MKNLKEFVDLNHARLVELSYETAKLLSLMAEAGLFKADERLYPFAQPIYDRGQWFDEHGNPEPPGTAYLGVVMDKRIEVSIGESWGGCERFHRPNALLQPGQIFGTFEACDALNQTPSVQNYTVFSGTPTFYFADPLLDTTIISAKHSSTDLANKLGETLGVAAPKMLEKWKDTKTLPPSNRGLALLNALTPKEGLAQWRTHVVLIPISKSLLSSNEAMKAVALINEVAWQQSTHLRMAGIESYSRSELMKAVRGSPGETFPEAQRADIVRELAAMRQTLLGARPGFREIRVTENDDGSAKSLLEQYGPFLSFFSALNETLNLARNNKGKLKWTSSDDLAPHVYVSDYLYSASKELIYPLWMHSVPGGDVNEKDSKKGWKSHSEKLKLLTRRKAIIDSSLFHSDPAYSARRYEIQNCMSQVNSPLLLRGHARIKPLIDDFPIFDESVIPQGGKSAAGVIAVQHLMEETLVLFKEILRRKIAKPESITVIGKPYSSSPEIVKRFKQLGINVVIPEAGWHRGKFCEFFNAEVSTQLEKALNALSDTNSAVLLLDDGGSLIAAASSQKSNRTFIAVEQTSRGVVAARQAKFPVVLVACSALKSIIEPEFVARAAINKLARYHPEVLQAKKIGVVGLGNVGGYLAKYLLMRRDIHFTDLYIHDSDQKIATQICEFAGAVVTSGNRNKPTTHGSVGKKALLRNAEVIYGCTGNDLGKDLFESHPGQLLVSLSSNDIEFATLLKSEKSSRGQHFDTVRVREKNVIAGGFPVTFNRDVSSAPLIEMQLTRALLLAGIEQAISSTAVGPVALDAKVQWKIWEKWQEETGLNSNEPGAKTWRDARDKEKLSDLANLVGKIGAQDEWEKKNKERFDKAIGVSA